jgi:hypothetical protein
MLAVRHWSVRNARFLEVVYNLTFALIRCLDPLWRRIGLARLERPAVALEASLKGFLFDCQMCGRCILSSTGMSCPMNCPKGLRNGPCGGVRANGNCEVEPEMACVWVEAWEGSRRMRDDTAIRHRQEPVDHAIQGTSAWLRLIAERAAEDA